MLPIMYRRTPLLSILLLTVPGFAWSYTQAEIDAAALVAEQIEIVADIADDVFQGRNNNTAESTAVQTLLINELKLISNRLNGAGVPVCSSSQQACSDSPAITGGASRSGVRGLCQEL